MNFSKITKSTLICYDCKIYYYGNLKKLIQYKFENRNLASCSEYYGSFEECIKKYKLKAFL